MEDNFEWEEYKEKVDELTRKFEELKDQVSGEAAEDSFDLFSGVEATPPRQNITHYVGNLGDTLSIGNYQELKDAFEVFAKASEADGRVKVIHGDTLVGSAGTNDKIYCLVTVADEASLSGFQSSSPAPFNGEHVWGYHIWTSASGGGDCCCCCCKEPYSNTLSFEHTGMGGLNWDNVSYDLETCSYHASTTSNNQYANGGNFSGNFLIDFKYTESRGWQLTLTTDQFAIVSTEQIYTGGGTGSGYTLDLADDFHPCNVDIPAATGFASSPGVLQSTSSSITVT